MANIFNPINYRATVDWFWFNESVNCVSFCQKVQDGLIVFFIYEIDSPFKNKFYSSLCNRHEYHSVCWCAHTQQNLHLMPASHWCCTSSRKRFSGTKIPFVQTASYQLVVLSWVLMCSNTQRTNMLLGLAHQPAPASRIVLLGLKPGTHTWSIK